MTHVTGVRMPSDANKAPHMSRVCQCHLILPPLPQPWSSSSRMLHTARSGAVVGRWGTLVCSACKCAAKMARSCWRCVRRCAVTAQVLMIEVVELLMIQVVELLMALLMKLLKIQVLTAITFRSGCSAPRGKRCPRTPQTACTKTPSTPPLDRVHNCRWLVAGAEWMQEKAALLSAFFNATLQPCTFPPPLVAFNRTRALPSKWVTSS